MKATTAQQARTPEPLTVEELLAELALLTSTETIPPSQLLTIIAKSHVALTAQFVAFQNQQAAENHELRRTFSALADNIERRLEPQNITSALITHNKWPALVMGIILPIATILTIAITHLQTIRVTWTAFTQNPNSLYAVILALIIPIGLLIFILIRTTVWKSSP